MRMKQIKIGCMIVSCYVILAIVFQFLAGDEFKYKENALSMMEGEQILAELNDLTYIEQRFHSQLNEIDKISLKLTTLGRKNQGVVKVQLIDLSQSTVLNELEMETALLQEGTYYEWVFANRVENARNKDFLITFQSNCKPGMAPAIFYNEKSTQGSGVQLNGTSTAGDICFAYVGNELLFVGKYYWTIAGIVGLLLAIILCWSFYKHNKGEQDLVFTIYHMLKRYKFLMQQLVARDFKTKYKRSVLGYLWSFLNPLLTMIVQYIVFSTIFRSDIKNFPVYLLSGIILFNFFSEAVGQGLSAIVGNTALITKVYVPKYIYPITKVLSCSINLVISMIPLLFMLIFTGTKITKAILLLPFALICLLVFCIGMSLILSSSMVFFRDTQYLWGIVSLAWMYATPLFYPENIIPPQFKFIHKLNPMYYIIKFARCILIDGISPDPKLYGLCALCAFVSLAIGLVVFKKTQDKFVLYL